MQDWASDDYLYSSGSTLRTTPPINNEGLFLTNIDNVDREREPARGATYNYTPYACNKCSHILPPFMLNESNANFAAAAAAAAEKAAEAVIEKAHERAEKEELKKMMKEENDRMKFMIFILIIVVIVLYNKSLMQVSYAQHHVIPVAAPARPAAPSASAAPAL